MATYASALPLAKQCSSDSIGLTVASIYSNEDQCVAQVLHSACYIGKVATQHSYSTQVKYRAVPHAHSLHSCGPYHTCVYMYVYALINGVHCPLVVWLNKIFS